MVIQILINLKSFNLRRHIFRNFSILNLNKGASSSETNRDLDKKVQNESALFVSGNKAKNTFSVLSPYLDFTKQFQNIGKLESNIHRRGLDINARELYEMWTKFKELESRKEQLEKERVSIAKSMKELAKSKKSDKETQKYKSQGKEIREQLKLITQDIWSLEEKAVIGALRLPNDLHQSTLEYDKELVKLFEKPKFGFCPKSHLELGKIHQELELLDVSPTAYYLKSGLAMLELVCNDFFLTNFKTHGYVLQINPDFVKAVVAEGCGVTIDDRVFPLASHESDIDSNVQYLVGGASLQAFAAYFTKQMISNPECLPQKLVSTGRNYSPTTETNSAGLLHASQSVVVNAILLYHNQSLDEELLLNEVLMTLVQSYSSLKLHFRLMQYSAIKLEPQESAAIGLEMFSPITKEYHEIGRISLYGDFISRRLLSLYKTKSSANFLSMIHIRACHVSKLLAILMENGQKEDGSYEIPECLNMYCEK